MSYSLKTIFDRFEKDKAVLLTPWGQEIFWPANDFPNHTEPGKIFNIKLDRKEKEIPMQKKRTGVALQHRSESEKEALAKKMLEELLNQSSSAK